MKFPYGFMLVFPYLASNADGSVSRNYARLTTNGEVDKRRVKRGLRRWVKSELGRTVHSRELHALMRAVKPHKEPMMYAPIRKVTTPVSEPFPAHAET